MKPLKLRAGYKKMPLANAFREYYERVETGNRNSRCCFEWGDDGAQRKSRGKIEILMGS